MLLPPLFPFRHASGWESGKWKATKNHCHGNSERVNFCQVLRACCIRAMLVMCACTFVCMCMCEHRKKKVSLSLTANPTLVCHSHSSSSISLSISRPPSISFRNTINGLPLASDFQVTSTTHSTLHNNSVFTHLQTG